MANSGYDVEHFGVHVHVAVAACEQMYVGEYKDRLRDGQGSYTFPGGGLFHYSGTWSKGKMHGQGTFSIDGGMNYEGEFRDGEIEGVGLKRWPDGSSYSGHFRQGEMHGEGVYLSAKGERYEGHWESNQRCGFGELVLPNKDVYRGDFAAHKPHGRGKMVYAATDHVYDGEWVAGQRDGSGILTDALGNRLYEGTWKAGKRHGDGSGILAAVNCVDKASEAVPGVLSYDGVWVKDKPAEPTTKIVLMTTNERLVSAPAKENQNDGKGDELQQLPAELVIKKKQLHLPLFAAVCMHDSESEDGTASTSARVQGEHGRLFRLRIFEGRIPVAIPEADANPEDELKEADATARPSPWQFVSARPRSVSRSSLSRGTPSGRRSRQSRAATPARGNTAKREHADDEGPQSGQADAEKVSAEQPTEAELEAAALEEQLAKEKRLDAVTVQATAGVAVFGDLALPLYTLVGDYHLVCESLASDVLPPFMVALSVVD